MSPPNCLLEGAGERRERVHRLSPGGLVAATKGKPFGESQAGAASDARAWVEMMRKILPRRYLNSGG